MSALLKCGVSVDQINGDMVLCEEIPANDDRIISSADDMEHVLQCVASHMQLHCCKHVKKISRYIKVMQI